MEPHDVSGLDDAACDRILVVLDGYGKQKGPVLYGLPKDPDSRQVMRRLIRAAVNPPADPLYDAALAFLDRLDDSLDIENGGPCLSGSLIPGLAAKLCELIRSAK